MLGVDGYTSRRQDGTTGYLFKNAHGDVLSAYSSTTNKLAAYTYDAWGNEQSKTETSNFTNNPLRYCGEYYDYESGMTYLRARYYDSSIKRFISEDPAKDGLNWYAYANNNPVMFVDPSGLSYDEVINALNNIYYQKNVMNSNSPKSYDYQEAYRSAMDSKRVIENSDVYIEDWSGLRNPLDKIVNGDNNSLDNIYNTRETVIAAKNISNNKDFWDDVFFTGGIAVAVAPLIKGIGVVITSKSIAVGTSLGPLGTLINKPNISVNWNSTTRHAIERMQERGITKQMVEQWIRNGKVLQQSSEKFVYISKQGVAVITNAGKLITAYGKEYFDQTIQQIVDKLF